MSWIQGGACRSHCVLTALAVTLVSGCAHYPHTPPLGPEPIGPGYSLQRLSGAEFVGDGLFVILTLSGGGTRAAALAHGVLLEMARWKRPGQAGTLLDEVDLISSVSGGSFAAAHFALHGASGLEDFSKRFLYRNAEWALAWRMALFGSKLIFSPYYSRADLVADYWKDKVFGKATFGDLLPRPFLLINATEAALGTQFSFVQEQFSPLCADLLRFPVYRAVTASSAFPGAINPVTLEKDRACDYSPPDWAVQAAEGPVDMYESDWAGSLRVHAGSGVRYVHLLDGGVSDNLGLRPIVAALDSAHADWSLRDFVDASPSNRVLVIVVDAQTRVDRGLFQRPTAPAATYVLDFVGSYPMARYTRQTLAALERVADLRNRSGIRVYTPIVAFREIRDPEVRTAYEQINTSLHLPRPVVDRLSLAGSLILQGSAEFRRFVEELGFQRTLDPRPQLPPEPPGTGR